VFELLVVGGLVLIIARASRRFNEMERRIGALEVLARVAPDSSLPVASTIAGLPPLPTTEATPAPAAEAPLAPASPTALPTTAPVPPVASPPPVAAPVAGRGFEEALGTRWAVWVGGIALAFGGIFLVRYSIEQELIGPRLRVALGLLFAAALIVAGEWLRRREQPLAIPAFSTANIPAILTAAGTSTAFATVYAAYGLYGLIGPALAFVALGAVSLVTMAAATLHGPALAGLGLVAALASPLLVESQDPSPVALVLFLAFAIGSAYGVARLKLWRWLALAAAAGALLWGGVLVVMGSGWLGGAMTHVLVQLALALLFLVADPYRHPSEDDDRIDRIVAPILFAFALLTVVTADDLGAGAGRPVFVGIVAAMMAAAAWRFPAAAPGVAAAALAAIGTLAIWPVESEAAGEPLTIIRDLASAPRPEALSTYLTAAILLNALVAAAGFGRLAVGAPVRPAIAAWYVGAATLGPLASLVVAYWRVTAFDRSVPFALAAAALGALFAVVAGWLRNRDPSDSSPAIRLAIGVAAAAAVAALAAGLTFAFDRGVLTVTLALSALGAAIIAERASVPALRYVVGALGIAVAGRLAWDPSIMQGEIGATPIVNWLLWGYGVPALAFGLAARILARTGRDRLVRFVEGLSILFSALLVFLEIRHALHAGDPFAPRSNHLEAGLVVTEAIGFTLLLTRLDLRWPDPLYRFGSLAFGLLSLLGALLALGLRYNPYLTDEPILGPAILSSLVPAYLIPAALAAAVAAAARRNRPRAFVLTAAGVALLLELAYACLEVRHLFQGARIGWLRSTSQGELWCYSLVLMANAIALLAAGFWRDSRVARLASAACMVIAVLKVFLIDLSVLEGLTRALSFVGLGLALVAIGFVYQRLLAARASSVT